MARLFEHDPTQEGSSYWIAVFYGLTIIAAVVAVGLVVYYAL